MGGALTQFFFPGDTIYAKINLYELSGGCLKKRHFINKQKRDKGMSIGGGGGGPRGGIKQFLIKIINF